MTEKKFSQTLIASDYLVENVPSAVKIASGVTVEELVAFTVTGDARLFIYDGDMYITNADITGVFSDKDLGITFADGTVIAASDSISAAGDCVLLAGFTSSGKSAVTAVYGKRFICIDETLYCDNAVNNWGGVYRIYPGESTLSPWLDDAVRHQLYPEQLLPIIFRPAAERFTLAEAGCLRFLTVCFTKIPSLQAVTAELSPTRNPPHIFTAVHSLKTVPAMAVPSAICQQHQ